VNANAARALDRAREAAAAATRGELGSLRPQAQMIEAEAHAALGATDEALLRVREAAASFAAWRSGPGEARCALLELRLLGPRATARRVAQTVRLADGHRADLVGWLREGARWVSPMLAKLLGQHPVEGLLADLGEPAVDAIIEGAGPGAR
jgi:hypothetical protein